MSFQKEFCFSNSIDVYKTLLGDIRKYFDVEGATVTETTLQNILLIELIMLLSKEKEK